MIIFVGDSPSPKMSPGAKPFEGAVCQKRLMAWITSIGTTRYNIINQSDFTTNELPMGCLGHKVIALGNKASNALSKAEISHFKMPHPSGRNRQINNKEFVTERLKACKDYINEQD